MTKSTMLFFIIFLKTLLSWIALNVFVKVTTVSDPFYYVNATSREGDALDRTVIIWKIASYIGQNFNTTLPHYAFSIVSGLAIWLLIIQLPWNVGKFALILLFFPSVSIWSALVSKESLAATAVCLILTSWVRIMYNRGNPVMTSLFCLFGFGLYAILRPHYFIGACLLITSTLLLQPRRPGKISAFITNRLSFAVIAILSLVLIITFFPVIKIGLEEIIDRALLYFRSADGGSSRNTWLAWKSHSNFYDNFWWALPFSVIGPLPLEAINKAILAPAFLEGLIILLMPVITGALWVRKIRHRPDVNLRFLYILFFIILPITTFYLILVHAPMGTVNAGSAVRYRTGFEYLITIPWLVVSTLIFRVHSHLAPKLPQGEI